MCLAAMELRTLDQLHKLDQSWRRYFDLPANVRAAVEGDSVDRGFRDGSVAEPASVAEAAASCRRGSSTSRHGADGNFRRSSASCSCSASDANTVDRFRATADVFGAIHFAACRPDSSMSRRRDLMDRDDRRSPSAAAS